MTLRTDSEDIKLEKFSLSLPSFQQNPYKLYEHYRSNDPVHWGEPMSPIVPGTWYIFNFKLAEKLLKNSQQVGRELQKAIPKGTLPDSPVTTRLYAESEGNSILFLDPPRHDRLKALLNKAFTPQRIAELSPRIEEIADRLLSQINEEDEWDLYQTLASPLPVMVLSELLGVPPDKKDLFMSWATALAVAFGSGQSTPEVLKKAGQAREELFAYLAEVIAERKKDLRDDLISDLIKAEETGSKLSREELIANTALLLMLSHRTTATLITMGTWSLLKHPSQLELLRKDPTLMENAVEELARFVTPSKMLVRWVFEDLELGGKVLHKGDSVAVVIDAANRDPEQFPDPESLNITRENLYHGSFGFGIHYCLGASLARVVTKIAFSKLVNFAKLELADTELEQNYNSVNEATSLMLSTKK